MSQHQQAFRPDISSDVSRIALRALAVLVAERCPAPPRTAQTSADQLCGMLYSAVLSPNPAQMPQKLHDIRALGVSIHEIKTVLVPAIARLLGDNWLEDKASFGDVTWAARGYSPSCGTWRLLARPCIFTLQTGKRRAIVWS